MFPRLANWLIYLNDAMSMTNRYFTSLFSRRRRFRNLLNPDEFDVGISFREIHCNRQVELVH